MKRVTAVVALLAALASQACLAQAAQPPPVTPPPAAQAPPDTEIYLAPLKITNGTIEIGAATNITNNPGYDNQPFFTLDGRALLFTSVRGPSTALGTGGTQTDIYRYELPVKHSEGLAAGRVLQVTNTPESEYSPTVTPAGALSVIRVELDGTSTQRLWQFTADGREPRVVLENVKPVGYHAWADEHTLALFVLGQPATLQLADTRTGTARTIASEIGRSIQRIPGAASRAISFVQRERVAGGSTKWLVKRLDPATGDVTALAPALDGGTDADVAWTPDGTLVTARNGVLLGWKPGQPAWKEIVALERLSLSGVTRLAVSPKGDFIALVGSPRQAR
jgi:opacity protein-like surface antigen